MPKKRKRTRWFPCKVPGCDYGWKVDALGARALSMFPKACGNHSPWEFNGPGDVMTHKEKA